MYRINFVCLVFIYSSRIIGFDNNYDFKIIVMMDGNDGNNK